MEFLCLRRESQIIVLETISNQSKQWIIHFYFLDCLVTKNVTVYLFLKSIFQIIPIDINGFT